MPLPTEALNFNLILSTKMVVGTSDLNLLNRVIQGRNPERRGTSQVSTQRSALSLQRARRPQGMRRVATSSQEADRGEANLRMPGRRKLQRVSGLANQPSVSTGEEEKEQPSKEAEGASSDESLSVSPPPPHWLLLKKTMKTTMSLHSCWISHFKA